MASLTVLASPRTSTHPSPFLPTSVPVLPLCPLSWWFCHSPLTRSGDQSLMAVDPPSRTSCLGSAVVCPHAWSPDLDLKLLQGRVPVPPPCLCASRTPRLVPRRPGGVGLPDHPQGEAGGGQSWLGQPRPATFLRPVSPRLQTAGTEVAGLECCCHHWGTVPGGGPWGRGSGVARLLDL